MVTYEDLVDQALIETGQFFLNKDDLKEDNLELNKDVLDRLIKRELAWYSKYHPIKKVGRFSLYHKKQFLEDSEEIPSNIHAIRRINSIPYPIFSPSQGRFVDSIKWRYDPITKTLDFWSPPDIYEVEYYVHHKYDGEKIETVDIHSPFVKLFVANFMIMIGRARSSFILNDIPFSTSAESLISEGQELLSSTKEFIQETSMYNYAMRI